MHASSWEKRCHGCVFGGGNSQKRGDRSKRVSCVCHVSCRALPYANVLFICVIERWWLSAQRASLKHSDREVKRCGPLVQPFCLCAPLSLSICLYTSLFLSVSFTVSTCLSVRLYFYTSLSLSVCLGLSGSVWTPLCLHALLFLSVSPFLFLCLFPCLPLSLLSVFVSIARFLSAVSLLQEFLFIIPSSQTVQAYQEMKTTFCIFNCHEKHIFLDVKPYYFYFLKNIFSFSLWCANK